MRLLIGLALLSLLILAIAVVGLGAIAVLRMPHRPDDVTATTPAPARDRQPVACPPHPSHAARPDPPGGY